jgi:hypothetical protein
MLKSREEITKEHSRSNLKIYWDEQKVVKLKILYLVECTICRCSSFRRIDQLQKSPWKCQGCHHFEIFNIANNCNFKYSQSVKSHQLLLSCISCGASKLSQLSHLKIGNIRCDNCLTLKYTKKLEQSSCRYVKRQTEGTSNITYVYYLTSEGVLCKTQSAKLLKDEWLHSTVKKIKVIVDKVFVYKFYFVNRDTEIIPKGFYYKIGISANPAKRLRKLKLDFKTDIEILDEFSNYRDALMHERFLHNENATLKVAPEIVTLFAHGKVSKKYPDGYTEWFFNKGENYV